MATRSSGSVYGSNEAAINIHVDRRLGYENLRDEQLKIGVVAFVGDMIISLLIASE